MIPEKLTAIYERTGRVDEATLNDVIADALGLNPGDYTISAQTLAIVNEAHDILLAGG